MTRRLKTEIRQIETSPSSGGHGLEPHLNILNAKLCLGDLNAHTIWHGLCSADGNKRFNIGKIVLVTTLQQDWTEVTSQHFLSFLLNLSPADHLSSSPLLVSLDVA